MTSPLSTAPPYTPSYGRYASGGPPPKLASDWQCDDDEEEDEDEDEDDEDDDE